MNLAYFNLSRPNASVGIFFLVRHLQFMWKLHISVLEHILLHKPIITSPIPLLEVSIEVLDSLTHSVLVDEPTGSLG